LKYAILLFILIPYNSNCQFIVPTIEPILGVNYFKSLEKPYESPNYSGVGIYYGLKGGCAIGSRLSIGLGTGMKRYPFDIDFFINATIKAYFYRNYQTDFSVFCELGIENSYEGGPTVPLFLGTNQYMGENVSFNFRVRIPTFLEEHFFRYTHHIELGLEVGLQFDFPIKTKKKLTVFGNPFILD
jgi:hypothetical protein